MALHPYGFESTPDILWLGQRCAVEEYAFHWEHFSKVPYLISPDKKTWVICELHNNVPYITQNSVVMCAATASPPTPVKPHICEICATSVSGRPSKEVDSPRMIGAETHLEDSASATPALSTPATSNPTRTSSTIATQTDFEELDVPTGSDSNADPISPVRGAIAITDSAEGESTDASTSTEDAGSTTANKKKKNKRTQLSRKRNNDRKRNKTHITQSQDGIVNDLIPDTAMSDSKAAAATEIATVRPNNKSVRDANPTGQVPKRTEVRIGNNIVSTTRLPDGPPDLRKGNNNTITITNNSKNYISDSACTTTTTANPTDHELLPNVTPLDEMSDSEPIDVSTNRFPCAPGIILADRDLSVVDPGGPDYVGHEGEVYSNKFEDDVKEATSLRHLMTHHPKNKHWHACRISKIKTFRDNKRKYYGQPPATFGEQVTADHKMLYTDVSKSTEGALDALMLYDRATRWVECYPVRTQTSADVCNCINHFEGPYRKIDDCYCDGSATLKRALDDHQILNDSCVPGVPRTNGVAERQVQEVINGTRSLLCRAGHPACFWPHAMAAHCFNRNIRYDYDGTDVADRSSPWRLGFKKEFIGQHIPFGALIELKPSPTGGPKRKHMGE